MNHLVACHHIVARCKGKGKGKCYCQKARTGQPQLPLKLLLHALVLPVLPHLFLHEVLLPHHSNRPTVFLFFVLGFCCCPCLVGHARGTPQIMINAGSAETSEVHICDARMGNVPQLQHLRPNAGKGSDGDALPLPTFKCLRAREQKVEYEVASFDGE